MRARCIEMFEEKKGRNGMPKSSSSCDGEEVRKMLRFSDNSTWNATMKTFFRDRLAVMMKTMRRVHHASGDCKLITCQQTKATDMDLIKVTRKSRSE